MKKNFSINLYGELYDIDEDAYETLDKYLKSMNRYFKKRKGEEEVADDIEHRVAELLWERKEQGHKTVDIDAIRHMNQDLRNLHDGRMKMPNMEQYNDHPTWLGIMIYYDFYAEDSVIKMPEDAYYGSQFDKMLELLCAEEKELTYKGCYGLCRQLGDTFIEELCDGRPYERNPALQDLIKYHLYSVPDVLRMNKFTLAINMKQSRTLAVS